MTEFNLKYEILKGLPPYGEMYISIPEESYSEGLPVRFSKNDGSEWVANFKCGDSELMYISELKGSDEILVIAKGICYIMNRNEREPIKRFGYDFKKIHVWENHLILIGSRDIAIVETSKKIKCFENLCLDFIEDTQIINGILHGILNNFNAIDSYDKTKFMIDLRTLKFLEYKKNHIRKPISQSKKVESKKWWEIWK